MSGMHVSGVQTVSRKEGGRGQEFGAWEYGDAGGWDAGDGGRGEEEAGSFCEEGGARG